MLRIALTCSTDKDSYFLRPRYIKYAESSSAAIIPLILPITENNDVIRAFAEDFDGFIFTGGDDIEPSRYGEEKLAECGDTEPARDAFELALLRELIVRNRPVFGICRGIQVMNVALGGTLWQDIKTGIPLDGEHAPKNEEGKPRHKVKLYSSLASLVGKDEITTNSYHHQAVKKAGDGLSVTAISHDGVIEGIEHKSLRYYKAVQWHPEVDPDPISLVLLEDFLAAAGK